MRMNIFCVYCTFGIRGGPGEDASHQTAVEKDFLGEAMVFVEMLQVLPLVGTTHG